MAIGYHMEQFSVYSRLLLTRESVATHVARLRLNLPKAGEVTVVQMTEKQYENRMVLVSKRKDEQKPVMGTQLTLMF